MTGSLPKAWTPAALEEWRRQELGALGSTAVPDEREWLERLMAVVGEADQPLRAFLTLWVLLGLGAAWVARATYRLATRWRRKERSR